MEVFFSTESISLRDVKVSYDLKTVVNVFTGSSKKSLTLILYSSPLRNYFILNIKIIDE